MASRSAILAAIAAALFVADGFWVYERYFRLNAAITYVGLDSVAMMVPDSARAAQLRDGKWDTDPNRALAASFYHPPPAGKGKPMAFVSLGPHAGLSQAVTVFRNLKARHVCHVLVRESGTATSSKIDFGKGPEAGLEVPALVLCGDGYGDAGFTGTLPADHLIHVSVQDGALDGN